MKEKYMLRSQGYIMKSIRVGNDLVEVPQYYLGAEAKYTAQELDSFISSIGSSHQEAARQKVLQKRIEFYQLFKSGEVIIHEPPTEVGWGTRLLNYLTWKT